MVTINAYVALLETDDSWQVLTWTPHPKITESFKELLQSELHSQFKDGQWLVEQFTIKITKNETDLIPCRRIVHSKTMYILEGFRRLNKFEKSKPMPEQNHWETCDSLCPFTLNGEPTEPAFGPEYKPHGPLGRSVTERRRK